VSCYIVNAPTDRQAEQAREILADEYLIVPDVPLSLPVARTGAETRFRRPRAPEWPDVSGIQEAHRRGITGEQVIVGVLDTGCDADHNEFAGKRIEFRYVPFVPTPESMRAVNGFDTPWSRHPRVRHYRRAQRRRRARCRTAGSGSDRKRDGQNQSGTGSSSRWTGCCPISVWQKTSTNR
jgi:hypothetical protein